VRYSHALWGGRFNPILVIDREAETDLLIDLFRVDFIMPIGESVEVKNLPKRYPHLITPFFHDAIFIKGNQGYPHHAKVLDVYNALAYLRDKPEWKAIKEKGLRLLAWQPDDSLADAFLTHWGEYPSIDEVGTDYRALFMNACEGTVLTIDPGCQIPAAAIEHPGISFLSRYGLSRLYNVRSPWDSPGFFVGSVSDVDDLVCYWNLRACDIPLLFVDPLILARYEGLIPAWEKAMRERIGRYHHQWDGHVAIWTRREDLAEANKIFPNSKLSRCHVSDALWNGYNLQAPTMHLGQGSALGIVGSESGRSKVSFALPEKPFCDEIWFHDQHLVASMSLVGGLYGDERQTFDVPYLPELNEFYARTMHFQYNKLRIEPGRIGLVIDAAEHDTFLYALPVAELIERVFSMAGYDAKLSSAGLIARQLISQLGGLQGARVFKVPGVRRLLKTHGPGASFTRRAALQIIASKDPNRPEAKFSDHEGLFIEPRAPGEKLRPEAVFGHLVEKGLLRIGVDLNCPGCRMRTWIPLEALKQRLACDLCGHEHDATRQLADRNEWHYRRSGVLGVEKNAQGAVAVLLTLQQLDTSLNSGLHGNIYSTPLELRHKEGTEATISEVDFVWIIEERYLGKTAIILGECKDQGPITAEDVANLERIADALPQKRFETFVLLSQLAPFTAGEIKNAKTLNDKYRRRVILLTARELEPYFIYERVQAEVGAGRYGSTPEDMASMTAKIYFGEQ
jgi:hypothetical protein